jgi:dTDP-3,4-didehydro-2,6-dideoxy-alpha-D-glucose 3-reductase
MNRPLQIGVLGCSSFAQRSMIPAIKSLPEQFELVGIASRTVEKSIKCSKAMGIQRSYSSYDKLIDEEGLDAVYMPLPNSIHSEWIDKALDRGLHVIVEKSLACNSSDVIKLSNKADELGLALVENFQFRFHRQLRKIERLLKQGRIGELRSIRSSFGFPPFEDQNNIRYQKCLCGGALLDAGAYPIKIAQYFMGDKLTITSASLYTDPIKGVDIWGGGVVQKDGSPIFAQIAFGFDNHYQCNIELWGSRGKLITNRIFTAPPGFSPEIVIEDANGTEVVTVEEDNHYANMLTHFYKVTTDTELATIELKNNIRQSILIEQFRDLASYE